jgi:hypothetical protein
MTATPQIAVLVVCHRTAATALLLKLLDSRFAVFVHVDARTDLATTPLPLPSNAKLTEVRFPVFWGGFNMVRACREMVRVARQELPQAKRYVLISGDALPVMPIDRLVDALLDYNNEFMSLVPVQDDPTLRNVSQDEAMKRYNWLQPWRFQNFSLWDNILTCPRTEVAAADYFGIDQAAAQRLRSEIHYEVTQPLLRRMPPRPKLFQQFFFGASWWALTKLAIDLIFDDMFDPKVEEFFQFMETPDEFFFHCLIGRHKSFLDDLGRTWNWDLMFVDHDDPVRHQFGDDALESSVFFECHAKTGSLFARKFNPARARAVSAAIENGTYLNLLRI